MRSFILIATLVTSLTNQSSAVAVNLLKFYDNYGQGKFPAQEFIDLDSVKRSRDLAAYRTIVMYSPGKDRIILEIKSMYREWIMDYQSG